jgi:hypothetical protein
MLGIAAKDQSPLNLSSQPSPERESDNGAIMAALIAIC